MNYQAIINLELTADSEKEAKERLIEFMRTVFKTEPELGLIYWDLKVDAIPKTTNSS